jgi:hypothetical protein
MCLKCVNVYIDHKLFKLDQEKQYEEEVRSQIAEALRKKSDGTFLWLTLVCNALELAESYDAVDILSEMPSGLKELYGGMMSQIQQLGRKDPDFCKRVLSRMTLAYRPLHLSELEILADIPNQVPLISIVKKCASFLTIREGVVYLIHQSVKDYLSTNADLEICQIGLDQGGIHVVEG